MKAFEFRLDKVLQFRQFAEEWAKDAYLDIKAQRMEAEAVLVGLMCEREKMFATHVETVDDCQTLDLRLALIEDQINEQKILIGVLETEEGQSLATWQLKRAEAEAVSKLRESAYAEWQAEMDRGAQKELDEWTIQRRKAA